MAIADHRHGFSSLSHPLRLFWLHYVDKNRNSENSETEFCRQSGDIWQSKTLFLEVYVYPRSSIGLERFRLPPTRCDGRGFVLQSINHIANFINE